MNLPVILFAFITISFCIYNESCGTNDVDGQIHEITLSAASKEELKKYSECTYNLEDVFKKRKQKYYQMLEKREQEFSAILQDKDAILQDKDEQLISTQFLCALNTAKADIHVAISIGKIFVPVVKTASEETLWESLDIPFDTKHVLRTYDEVKDKELPFYEDRFRNLYFRLKFPKYDGNKNPFMEFIREGIRLEYAGQDNIDELYMNFAATIARDYIFLCESYHDEILKVLKLLGTSPNDDILHHLFKINERWFMDGTHIKNINILRKAFYRAFDKVDVPEVRGYPCRNNFGVDIQLPLYDKCGRIRTTTETGTPSTN